MSDDIFKGYGLRVELKNPKDFNLVVETISRIGFAAKSGKTLYQSCHIFHKQGNYAIMHFKEMFAFDGRPADITEGDIARRNKIAMLLEEWGLIKILDKIEDSDPIATLKNIKIVPYKEKNEWTFEAKYTLGNRK